MALVERRNKNDNKNLFNNNRNMHHNKYNKHYNYFKKIKMKGKNKNE